MFIQNLIFMEAYQQSFKAIIQKLKSNEKSGFNQKEIWDRRKKYGFNKLEEKGKKSTFLLFLDQFKSALIVILIVATIVSAVIGERIDASVILVIVILNAVFWFIQEYKAEKALESLKQMMSLHSKVIRNGKKIEIDSSEVLPWDILVIEEWDKISADARLIQSINLQCQESALTGESLPVSKHIDAIKKESALWDQKNMLFSWTIITRGRGLAIVTSIWMQTQIWKIAEMIQKTPDKKTPLQNKLERLSKRLGIAILIICIIVFLAYLFIDHIPILTAFITAVALAVAAIPEWLPAVVTISLSLWVNRMVKKNALMRKLSSVETLGSVDVICTDKTWTLTKNEMTVKNLYFNHEIFDVEGSGYNIVWEIKTSNISAKQKDLTKNKWQVSLKSDWYKSSLQQLLKIWILCNHAELQDGKILWDPTEWCLIVSAIKAGLEKEKLELEYIRKDEIPFDSTRKMMSTIHKKKWEIFILSKWAPEIILQRCDKILDKWKERKITQQDKKKILEANSHFASNAMRVLWFAYNTLGDAKSFADSHKSKKHKTKWLEDWLIFVGLQAMIDPPRDEVKDSILICKQAGIRVIMITWDNIQTAKAIAHQLWIEWDAIEWLEMDKLKNLTKTLKKISIFARVNPEHKQEIITALKKQWHIVSMTWDWVNDAPALKQADIGIAMWITWTDVAKEASDMILLDDNFSTIVSAIEEWRWIFDNIKKFVNYLLATNFGEILIIFIASLMGLPLPLIAIQILRINLVTDGLPALALWVDPIDKHIMKRKARRAKEWIVTKDMIRNIIVISSLMTIWALFIFYKNYHQNIHIARTMVFVFIVLMEMVKVMIIRKRYGSRLFENKRLRWAIALSLPLVFLIVYTPLNTIFKTQTLSWANLLQIMIVLVILGIIGFISVLIMGKGHNGYSASK